MTPRRSSRARTSQPSPAILQHTNSSSSSASLTRERSTRSNAKNPSPQGSSGHRSQSIDDADAAKLDFPQTRQRQRARGDEEIDKIAEVEEEEGEEDEEEEITRCLCGQQEYPGLPPSRRDLLGRNGMHGRVKDDPILNFSADSSDLMSDEIGSMFIQCDQCKVWQHGGCVGIMDEAMSPDEYFCEECRKDLHRIKNESNGYVHHNSRNLYFYHLHNIFSSSLKPVLLLWRGTTGTFSCWMVRWNIKIFLVHSMYPTSRSLETPLSIPTLRLWQSLTIC